MLRACVIDFGSSWDTHLPLSEFSYNSYHSCIRCALFETLYGRKYRSHVLWSEIRENRLIGPALVQETTDKVVLIKERLKAARYRQKSFANKMRKLLEFKDSPEYQDTANSGGKKETKAMVFHKMDTEEISDRFVAPCFVNGLEAYDGEINLGVEENLISNEYAVKLCLKHKVKRGNKVVKKELIVALRDEIYFVKFIINPEEDDVEPGVIFGRSFLRMTKAITDFGAKTITIYPDIDPFLEDIEEEEKRKNNRKKKRAMENLNLVYQDIGTSSSTGRHLTQEEAAKEALAIRISQKADDIIGKEQSELDGMNGKRKDEAIKESQRSNVMGNVKSDSDYEEEYEIKRNNFRVLIYGPKPAPYLNCNDTAERSLALQTVTNPFRKISVWKKSVSFLGSLQVPLKHVNWKPDYKGCYTREEEATGQQWEETMLKPDHQDPNNLDNLKSWKKYCFHKFIINSYYGKVATMRQNLGCDGEIDDMLRIKLLCADDELQSKKIIKFRLGGRAHNFTLLEFAHRLGLYHVDELEEDGFDVYFQGGLRSDDNFNAQEYWLSIHREENLGLSRIHASTIRNLILRVIHKTITYGLCQRTTGYDKIQKNDLWLLSMIDARHQNGYANVAWLITRWMKRKGVGTQEESQICYGKFITKIAKKARVLIGVVLRNLSALIYCRDLDTTTLRELIDCEGRLIPEDPQPGVPRVGIPRPPRASMQALYDRMGSMEIHQEAIERMEYREPTIHLVTLSYTMISIINSTHLHHHSINNSSRMMMSNHASCLNTRKSTSGGIQFLGGDKLVSWSSKKQDCTSMSLAEAETEYQLADLFTKDLHEDRFKYLVRRLGMRYLTLEELEVLANESA
ncbi:hypothetical protein Tco_0080218 [Tanacetum coccineum]